MPAGVGEIINSVADIFGQGPASKQASAVESAAQKGADAAAQATNLQRQMFEKQIELQEPFRQAGLSGQNRLLELLGIGGTAGAQGYGRYATADFTPANFLANQDPGYAFRMSEGMKALERSAAARGGLLSGATLKGTQRYGQDLASQEYQNAFNRYQTTRANTLNSYASLAGVAQTSANTLGQAAGQYGANAGNIAMMGGANAGNAQLALGNIRGQQFSNAANALGQGYNFYKQGGFNNLFGSGGGSYSGPSYGTNPDFSNSDFDTMSYD
jgi:hypothetical protein